MAHDCQLIKSDRLNITLPTTIGLNIPYSSINPIIGLSLYYQAQLANEVMSNDRRRWKSEMAKSLCISQNTHFKFQYIELSDLHNLEKGDALLMDLIILQNSNDTELVCQADVPSAEIMTESDCQACINDLAAFLGVGSVNITSLHLKNGINNIYVNSVGFTNIPPENTVCKDRATSTASIAEDLGLETAIIIESLKGLDQSLGSRYMKELDDIASKCDHNSLEDLMKSDPDGAEIKKCFKIQMKKRKQKNRKKRDLTLIKTGGDEDSDDPEMLKSINENFGHLSQNDKSLYKELLQLGLDKKLETKVIANHEQNLIHINNVVTGIETHSNLAIKHEEFLEHLLKHCRETYKLLITLGERIRTFQSYLSKALEDKALLCIDLNCFLPENVFLRSLNTGLSLFIKANKLTATEGISPSCMMNKQQLISKFHLKHLQKVNSSHFSDDNGDIVTKDCLEDYSQCDKNTELRKITKEDLLEDNLLISPARKDGYRIQCIDAVILKSKNSYQRCTMSPGAIQLPITTPSGAQIGHEDINISPHDAPVNSLKELSKHIFRSSLMKIKEMQALGNIKWKEMFTMDQVNHHHIQGGLTAGTAIAIIMAILAILHCIIRMCNGKTPCGTDCRKKNEEGNKEKKTKSWRWRRRKSSSSEDSVEMLDDENPTPPTAPALQEGANYPDLGIISQGAINPELLAKAGNPPTSGPNVPRLGNVPTNSANNPDFDSRPKYILDLGSLIRSSN